MRKILGLIGFALIAAILYGGYWFIGRAQVESQLTTAIADIDAGPQELRYGTLRTRGFPNRFDTTITDLTFSDPATAVTWAAPTFQLYALAYRPTQVIALFPNEQTLDVAGETFTLYTNDMRASGKVSPSTRLAFQTATIELDNPRIRAENGAELAMASLLAAMRLAPEQTQAYLLFLDARSIVPPEDLRRLIDPGNLQPALLQSFKLDSVLTLTSPLALNPDTPQQPEIARLTIRELALRWGEMSLTAIGDLTPDAQGRLSGSITLTGTNWRQAIDLGIANGTINADRRFLVTGIAENLDETPHIPDTLTLTIKITDGIMALGNMPLGPAPVLR